MDVPWSEHMESAIYTGGWVNRSNALSGLSYPYMLQSCES